MGQRYKPTRDGAASIPGPPRVSPFRRPAHTPQQANPTALPQPCRELPQAISCLQAQPEPSCPKKCHGKARGGQLPALAVSGSLPMPRKPPSRWAALKLVGNFANRQLPPPSTIPAWRPVPLPHRPPRAQMSESAFQLRIFPPAICSHHEARLWKEATRSDRVNHFF